ncbi:MAG: plasmid pRiA4b ORF-3 family protein, partial [Deltaproteobacteria bacterium]|nr:plasmid pRiA4b ORF-3 family protein [Deltaproteobacteria bacterium]
MIWILKVELLFGAYAEEEWEGTIEIESSSTLEDLHFALQDILNFDNDHMYEFYVSRTERSRDRIRYDDE